MSKGKDLKPGDDPVEFDSLQEVDRALAKAPGHPGLLAEAERLARRDGAFAVLADMLAYAFGRAGAGQKVKIAIRLGRLYRDDIGFNVEAVHWYAEALAADLSCQEASEQLIELCREREAWRTAVEVFAAKRDPELRHRAAQMAEKKLDDRERSVELYEALLDEDQKDVEAYEELARLYADLGDWEHLTRTYEKRLEVTLDRNEREDIAERLALINEAATENERAVTVKERAEAEPEPLGTPRASEGPAEAEPTGTSRASEGPAEPEPVGEEERPATATELPEPAAEA